MSLFNLPIRRLSVVLAFNLLASALALLLALSQPWLGLSLSVDDHGDVRVQAAHGPAAGIPAGARLLSLRSANAESARPVTADDLLEEPDVVADYVEMDAFFARQSILAEVLQASMVEVEWQLDSRAVERTSLTPARRPLSALAGMFWFQLAVSVAGCLVAGWVWALQPHDWGARMFAVTGLAFPLFAMPAAVYSTREIAMDGSLFQALSALNHLGAMAFGAALVAVFLMYPKPLVRPRHLVPLFAFYLLWWLAETLRLAPDLDWGHRFGVMSEMLLALLLGVVQWRRSLGDAAHRAALRWFILSMLSGSGLFILSTVTTVSLGWLPPLPQGYAFGFFLFIYLGIGLGLSRYHLFDLDVWAYRLLIWLGGALAVVGLDAALMLGLNWPGQTALAASLWAVALLYLPLRNWLWQRFNQQPAGQLHELLPDVVNMAFQSSQGEREMLWDGLLQRLYSPLELQKTSQSFATVRLLESGLALAVPACAGVGARYLRHPHQGGRLFSPKDGVFMDALIQLMNQAESSRAAQERGAIEERRRIARDMHDDVGARLLMLIHHAHTPEIAELARAAMNDLRAALAALDARPVPMADALADWRAEATSRCEAANVELAWRTDIEQPRRLLSSRQKFLLERALRESLSNALKHAQPSWVDVHLSQRDQVLELNLLNDGQLTSADDWQEGRGLRGMRQRLAEYGGRLDIQGRPEGGAHVTIHLPLHPELSI